MNRRFPFDYLRGREYQLDDDFVVGLLQKLLLMMMMKSTLSVYLTNRVW